MCGGVPPFPTGKLSTAAEWIKRVLSNEGGYVVAARVLNGCAIDALAFSVADRGNAGKERNWQRGKGVFLRDLRELRESLK